MLIDFTVLVICSTSSGLFSTPAQAVRQAPAERFLPPELCLAGESEVIVNASAPLAT
ncbi:hypothetical protein HB770_08880 [Rhizobium leguminosarum bv. viciae]|uniref:Uncharacterized protein n=1 Tax=Rhizobium leguminosarum bv. viciae TaxID=387 RepID=A0A7G6RH14_RHILV|nr:hypothetical protein HB770_08880 [Rhizobium leguminosarum bv. viciae]